MNLVSYPANYSSVFADNLFCFDQADVATPSEVAFSDADGALLGTKRFVGQTAFECSVSSYLRRLLAPAPLFLNRCAYCEAAGRNAWLRATWGDNQSSSLLSFTISRDNLSEGVVVGGSVQSRTISAGEYDEVLMVVGREKNLATIVTLSTGESINSYTKSSLRDGLWAYVVNADAMIARSSSPEQLEWFSVAFSIEGERVGEVTFELVPAATRGVRLGWLSASGQICYHNFPLVRHEGLMTESAEVELASGTTLLSKSGWPTMRINSGVVPSGVIERLQEIATSPFVWLIEGAEAEPLTLLSSEVVLGGGSGRGVSLLVRPAKRTTYW